VRPDTLEDSSLPLAAAAPGAAPGSGAERLTPWPAPAGPAGLRPHEGRVERGSHAALQILAQRVPVLVWTTDRDLRVTWRLRHPTLVGLDERLCRLLDSGDRESAAVVAHRRALEGQAAEFEQAWEDCAVEARVEPLRGAGGEVDGAVAVAAAVSEQDRRERVELVRAGLHDPLTQLPTRTLFVERLRRATAGADWCLEGLFVLLLDVDRFAEVNDRLGYEKADRLLAAMADRLRRRLRPGDTLARYGADAFTVLLGGIRDGRDAVRVASRLQAELGAPFDVHGEQVRMSASVGIAAGLAGQRPEGLLRDAERALDRAKLLGRAGCQVFQPGRDERETLLANVETAIRRALEPEELLNHYRPTVLRKDGKVAGFDIVLWRRKDEDLARPVQARPAQSRPAEARPAPARPTEEKPVESKPAEASQAPGRAS